MSPYIEILCALGYVQSKTLADFEWLNNIKSAREMENVNFFLILILKTKLKSEFLLPI